MDCGIRYAPQCRRDFAIHTMVRDLKRPWFSCTNIFGFGGYGMELFTATALLEYAGMATNYCGLGSKARRPAEFRARNNAIKPWTTRGDDDDDDDYSGRVTVLVQ